MDISKELNKLGNDIVTEAKNNVPKDSGKLKNSIKYKASNDKLVISQLEYGFYLKNNYMAQAIENGLDKNLDNIVNAMIEDTLKNL